MLAIHSFHPISAFKAGARRSARRFTRRMEHVMLAQPAQGWNIRGHTRSAVQADTQYATAPAATKQQQLYQQNVITDISTSDSDSDSTTAARLPLKLVVQDAVKRWFNETLSEARRGDVKQQALLAQMYAEGYGCQQDLEQSRVWAERARLRGYQMAGVYDSI